MTRRPLFSITKKDFKIETLKGSGPGGQHRNKTQTAVRITHPPSGAVGFAQEHRSQVQNRRAAFRRLYESDAFQSWLKIEIARRTMDEERIERKVDNWLRPRFLKIETGPFDD